MTNVCQRRVVVVVPAFDEEAFVGRVISTMPSFVQRIVVVDDGSRDGTSRAARAIGDPRLRLHRHPVRRGVGAAIATGYRLALAETDHPDDAIAVMAGDGQMDPEDLEAVVAPVIGGRADYVKGVRFGHPGVERTMGLPRWVGGQLFSRLTAMAIRRPITDSQCGYTAVARKALAALDLDGLWPSFGYPNDLLGQIAAHGMWIAEVRVRPVYGSERSKLRLRHLPPMLFVVVRAALRCRHPKGDIAEGCAAPMPYHLEEEENGCGRRDTRRGPVEASER